MITNKHFCLLMIAIALVMSSCNGDEIKPKRDKVDYNQLSSQTSYSGTFKDHSGTSTVDYNEANDRLKMYYELLYYADSVITHDTQVWATDLDQFYQNSSSPFFTLQRDGFSIDGSELNGAAINLRDASATSLTDSDREQVVADIERFFLELQAASASVTIQGGEAKPGRIGPYLVDAKGIETIEVIQHSLEGAIQLDMICNVLLDQQLTADNQAVVAGTNYTQLEHNWDQVFGLLTVNDGLSNGASNSLMSNEFGLAKSLLQYNSEGFDQLFPALLKGRAAIVNNDQQIIAEQAYALRNEFEVAIAKGAISNLQDWLAAATDAQRSHSLSVALGYIYTLRFAKYHNSDVAFSDSLKFQLTQSTNGFWDVTPDIVSTMIDQIKQKFEL